MVKKTHFERAVFLSWYCSKGDCKFCYMSTQKHLIKEPRKARRSIESIIAEVFLCKALGWKIEFLSGGVGSYTKQELLSLLKLVNGVYEGSIWLNIGALSRADLELFRPYIKGVCGAVECINPAIQKKVCPSKPIHEIESMFRACEELKLKKAMTLILGIGESEKDIGLLMQFVKKNKIDKITFYRLKPQKGTLFEKQKPIPKEYYAKWVRKTREEFPKIRITVGSWLTHLDEIHLLLKSGADAVTKFPSIKLFGTRYAKQVEQEAKKAGMVFSGTLTRLPAISYDFLEKPCYGIETRQKIRASVRQYLGKMEKNLKKQRK